jgi:hypothetical protein
MPAVNVFEFCGQIVFLMLYWIHSKWGYLVKKFIFSLFCSFIFLSLVAQAAMPLKISCNETFEGFQVTALFDSSAPLFRSKMAIDPQNPTESKYIDSDNVCGVNLNFTNNCQGEVRYYQSDVGYVFNCNNGVEGEAVLSAEQLTFSCSGPGVTEDFQDLLFFGCKTTNFCF